jgi:lipopolysaccharide biosynthesis glycosyltransferase
MRDRVVVLTVDPNYRMQLAAAMWSVAATNADGIDAVTVLTTGMAAADRDRIEGPVRDLVDVEWFDVDERTLASVVLPNPRFTVAVCFPLILAEVLPGHLDRVVYLDADVLVRGSIAPLFDIDLGGSMVGAVRDPRSPWLMTAQVPWRELSLEPAVPNFNNGVMAVPLSVWREREVAARSVSLLERYALPQLDQSALNVLANGTWKRLAPRFNAQNGHFFNGDRSLVWVVENEADVREAVESPVIVHFNAGERRPWESGCVHPYATEWFAALEHTAWAGWRPPPTQRLRQSVGSVRRRLRTAVHALRAG